MVQFLGRGGFVKAAHREQMVHFHAPRRNVSPDAMELRVIWSQCLQFIPKPVEFSVRNLGRCEVVIQM